MASVTPITMTYSSSVSSLFNEIANKPLDKDDPYLKSINLVNNYFAESEDNRIHEDKSLSIFEAAEKGDMHAVEQCIALGADVNATHGNFFKTALHVALQNKHLDVAQFLINNGADVNLPCANPDRKGYYEYVDTPLMWAAFEGHTDVARLLINNGADINKGSFHIDMDNMPKVDSCVYTPLHFAAARGPVDLVRLLIDNGADINSRDDWDETPLFGAVESGNLDIIKLLIDNGADVNVKDMRGRTALDRAKKLGNQDVVTILDDAKG